MRTKSIFLVVGALCALLVDAYPEQGKWNITANVNHSYIPVTKRLFKDSYIRLKVMCESEAPTMITIEWVLRKTPCGKLIIVNTADMSFLRDIFRKPGSLMPGEDKDSVGWVQSAPVTADCNEKIILQYTKAEVQSNLDEAAKAQEAQDQIAASVDDEPIQRAKRSEVTNSSLAPKNHIVTHIPADGVYLFLIHITSTNSTEFKAHLSIEMKGDYGYLSAADWPLLGFYSAMCVVYVIYGLMWLVVSFMQWRDLLRVQYWIGAVIFLGMLEKAMFTAEYESVNTRGISVPGLIVAAELVSCAKRTLARMLVIIVSLGFGIVKPRLGVVLHRVVGVGLLYFILASIESCMKALQPKYTTTNEELASVPVAVLDSAMCWWIFSALLQTTRTLRLRRNTVKLSLYRHFTNTLAFAVVASVIFMLWFFKYHRQDECLKDWMEEWVDDAYWHLLFALILLVIMVLWRPTNNNQRFAFTPLLDEGSDEEDEEEEQLMADVSDTMKQRNIRPAPTPKEPQSVEDDLKWVEENIPSTIADSALPLLDSDEEIVNTKFEMSKME
ncbi:transmembrane protein 87A [Oratosquilla oratoria]|uniref:transmembrane protein 87A n=1 Tax=Oratosquilla oratoria TaxID=337810 RepID=UPI003F75EDB3